MSKKNQGDNEDYEIGEHVLVFYGELLFDATVLEVDLKDNDPYFVHFHNWHKRYDMWVPVTHMNKFNKDNQTYQAELLAEDAERKREAAAAKKEKAKEETNKEPKKKQKG